MSKPRNSAWWTYDHTRDGNETDVDLSVRTDLNDTSKREFIERASATNVTTNTTGAIRYDPNPNPLVSIPPYNKASTYPAFTPDETNPEASNPLYQKKVQVWAVTSGTVSTTIGTGTASSLVVSPIGGLSGPAVGDWVKGANNYYGIISAVTNATTVTARTIGQDTGGAIMAPGKYTTPVPVWTRGGSTVLNVAVANVTSGINPGTGSGSPTRGQYIKEETTGRLGIITDVANATSVSVVTVGGNNTHPFQNQSQHIYEYDNGATMDFFGYANAPFKDFKYIPNAQKTKKVFEFAIEEFTPFDALDGTGFLFNTEINDNRTGYGKNWVSTLQINSSGTTSGVTLTGMTGSPTYRAPQIGDVVISSSNNSRGVFGEITALASNTSVTVAYGGNISDGITRPNGTTPLVCSTGTKLNAAATTTFAATALTCGTNGSALANASSLAVGDIVFSSAVGTASADDSVGFYSQITGIENGNVTVGEPTQLSQTMSGYLLWLNYGKGSQATSCDSATSGALGCGQSIDIYKFKNVNTRMFHHQGIGGSSQASPAISPAAPTTGTAMPLHNVADYPGFTRVATTSYNPQHKYRKIKLAVYPKSVDVYYDGAKASDPGASSVMTTGLCGTAELADWQNDPKHPERLGKTFNYATQTWSPSAPDEASPCMQLITVTDESPDSRPLGQQTYFNPGPGDYQVEPNSYYVALKPVTKVVDSLPLDANYVKSYGYGPITSYIGHGCARPSRISLRYLTMGIDNVKELAQAVREPAWRDDSYKYLVNVNDNPIKDFDDPVITGELLYRLQNDDIYYLGWASDDNSAKSVDFLVKNDLRGLIVDTATGTKTYTCPNGDNLHDLAGKALPEGLECNPVTHQVTWTCSADLCTRKTTYEEQLVAIADKIYENYYRQNFESIVLTTDNVELNAGEFQSDTTDGDWPNGKWLFVHRLGPDLGHESDASFLNGAGIQPLSGTPGAAGTNVPGAGPYMDALDIQFNLPGYYDIYFGNDWVKTVISHRPPNADFVAAIDPLTHQVTYTDLAYDPDRSNSPAVCTSECPVGFGIRTHQWSYLNLNVGGAPIVVDAEHPLPSELVEGDTYLIYHTVTDEYGVTATYTQLVRYVEELTEENIVAPIGYFDINPKTILKGVGSQDIFLTDNSYDTQGVPVTSSYVLIGSVPWIATCPTFAFHEGSNDVSCLPVGDYSIKLTVSNEYCAAGSPKPELCRVSQPITKSFKIVNDTEPPTATADPDTVPSSNTATSPIPVTLRFGDTGGAGLKQQRAIVTNTPVVPDSLAEGWTPWSPSTSRVMTVKIADGAYVCWQATDNSVSGNPAQGCFGPYYLQLQDIAFTSLGAAPADQAPSGASVTLMANLDKADATGFVYFYASGTALPSCPQPGSYVAYGRVTDGTAVSSSFIPEPGQRQYFARYCGDGQYGQTLSRDLLYNVTAPDLEITVAYTPESPKNGDVVGVRYTVKNIGNQPVSDAQASLVLPSALIPFGNLSPAPSKCSSSVPENDCLIYNSGTNSWTWQIGYLGPRIRGPEDDYTATVTVYGLLLESGSGINVSGETSTALTEYDWVNSSAATALDNNRTSATLTVTERMPRCKPLDVLRGEAEPGEGGGEESSTEPATIDEG